MKRKTFLACLLALAIAVFCVTSAGSYYYGIIEDNALFKGKVDVKGDGTLTVYDGTTKAFGVSSDGSKMVTQKETVQALVYTAGTGFELPSNAEASWYTVDVTAIADSNLSSTGSSGALVSGTAGVTIVLPTPTAAINKKVYPIHKIDSGATLVPLICPGGGTDSADALPINSTSGVTNVDMDALGDILYLMADYNSAVSWWIVSRYIH